MKNNFNGQLGGMEMPKKQSPASTKLFKLKEWLTVPEAAQHLSILFGEEVAEADVLRLCLDGHLTLSVNFVNHANAKTGDKFLSLEEWENKFRKAVSWETANFLATKQGLIAVYFEGFSIVFYQKNDELIANRPRVFGPDEKLKNEYLNKIPIDMQNKVLDSIIEHGILYTESRSKKYNGKVPPSINSFEGEVVTIKGIWNLPMLGTEKLSVEHKYQMLTSGPAITLTGFDGAFVEDDDGVVWQLQDRFDEEFEIMKSEEWKKKSLDFYAEHLKKRISNYEIDEKEAERLLDQKQKNLEKSWENNNRFYPAGGLPDDCVLVIRTKYLREFEQSIIEKTQMKNPEKRIKDNPKAIASLMKMIIAMAVSGYRYDPQAKKSEIPSEIAKDAEELGLPIDADTVRKWLKQASELLDHDIADRV